MATTFLIACTVLFIFIGNHAEFARAKNFKIVCYFTSWSNYRSGNGKFSPQDIDGKLCTHIVYSFATLDENSLTIKMGDSRVDPNLYQQITSFRQKGVKVSIAIGGGKDSQGAKYGRLLTDANARKKFIANAVDFLKIHNFNGLDLDLEVSLFYFNIRIFKNN